MSEQQYKDVDGCVLWKRIAKNGKLYLGGQVEIGGEIYKVRAFVNEFKNSADSPDFFFRKKNAEAVEKKKSWEEIVASGSRNGEGYNC
ncbi:MAG: hypothetical protein Q8K92_12240 [Leadbetterella sp.]|nr:hypothetical protein [Leadbetterella sp.]